MKSALVLAAGKGTRMKSASPKVMQPLLGEPILFYVLTALQDSGIEEVMVVVGHGAEEVKEYLAGSFPHVKTVLQLEQKGTGHAVMQAQEWLLAQEDVLVLNGDMPLVTAQELNALLDCDLEGGWAFATTLLDDPTGYGRVLRDDKIRIVEQKDATEEERKIKEVNVGLYRTSGQNWVSGLNHLTTNNTQGEYYIVDLLTLAQEEGKKVTPVLFSADNVRGVNNPLELSQLNALLRDRYVVRLMEQGVKFQDPSSVWIGPYVTFAGEGWIHQGVTLWGHVSFGKGCTVGAGCQITDCTFGDHVTLQPYVVAEDTTVDADVVLGPFCFLRGGTHLHQDSRVGKFVELKATTVGQGSKVPHLSYLGDATLGAGVNIGAATVTCNYDGAKKWPTHIGDRCFVGSDTMFVAPVTLESDSATAAGSVVTEDVPTGMMAIGRARQVNKPWKGKKREEA